MHPEYLHGRIEKIQGMFQLRVLLVLCDVVRFPNPHLALCSCHPQGRWTDDTRTLSYGMKNDHQESIREITKVRRAPSVTVGCDFVDVRDPILPTS